MGIQGGSQTLCILFQLPGTDRHPRKTQHRFGGILPFQAGKQMLSDRKIFHVRLIFYPVFSKAPDRTGRSVPGRSDSFQIRLAGRDVLPPAGQTVFKSAWPDGVVSPRPIRQSSTVFPSCVQIHLVPSED